MIRQYAVLLTCFSRKNVTLRCLKQLYMQRTTAEMDVFLCDDGSIDGTSDAVKERFPEVCIIKGTGHLYWNRGMLAAWQKACATKDYDAYIWLNDDAFLYDNALSEMLDCSNTCDDKSIVCGAFCSESGDFSYGGRRRDGTAIIPDGVLQDVYWLNGNCVLIPRIVVSKIGLLDKMFHHHLGDYDYGLRAIEAGFKIVSTRRYVGECKPNEMRVDRSRKNGLSVYGRFKSLYSPLGSNPIIQFRYTFRHFGIKEALFVFLALHWNNLLSDRAYKRKNDKKLNSNHV